MPDADYSFKATPEVGTFGSRVAHVADAQMMICSAEGRIEKGRHCRQDIQSRYRGCAESLVRLL